MSNEEEAVRATYEAFNARDIEAALAPLDRAVSWSDGKGGILHGKGAVREHWLQQWASVDPKVEIIDVERRFGGLVASIRLRMRPGAGDVREQELKNSFHISAGKILTMRIPDDRR